MKSLEIVIEYLEYGISLFKWAINSLSGFPVWKKTNKNEGQLN